MSKKIKTISLATMLAVSASAQAIPNNEKFKEESLTTIEKNPISLSKTPETSPTTTVAWHTVCNHLTAKENDPDWYAIGCN